MANWVRLALDQLFAPDYKDVSIAAVGWVSRRGNLLTIQAFLSGTMWSMSTSEAAVQVAPSKGENQVPDVAEQASLVTTLVPSRFKTYSLYKS